MTRMVVGLLLLTALSAGLDAPGALGPITPAADDGRVLRLRAEQAAAAARGEPTAVLKGYENRIQAIYLEYQPALADDGGGVVVSPRWWPLPELDGPDVVIDTGTIVATGADYESDGTMYVAYSLARDSSVRLVKSTDHGSTWHPLTAIWTIPTSLVRRVAVVVGSGDSAFVFVMMTHPDNNGDVSCVRIRRDGSGGGSFWVSHDSATINNFTFCRDYVAPYYLYACVGNDDHTSAFNDYGLRSTDFGRTWAQTNLFRFVSDGSYQAGAADHLYTAGYVGYRPWLGELALAINTFYGAPDSWRTVNVHIDTFPVDDPVIAPSFVTPPESATVWLLCSHNFQGSGDWDILYNYSTDVGRHWSSARFLAGSSTAIEAYGDLKPYAEPGNPWVNASYISETTTRTVFRHYCNQANPTGWSDTLRINTHSAGTGWEVRPLLVYSPGAPGTGAGCVFVGAGLRNLYWNSPWTAGLAGGAGPGRVGAGLMVRPNPVTAGAVLSWPGAARALEVFDAGGRLVRRFERPAGTTAVWDRCDGSGRRVAPGVYLVRLESESGTVARQLIVQ